MKICTFNRKSKLLMKHFFFLFFLFLFKLSFSQGYYYGYGARFASMGNAVSTMEDVWSYHHNPAGVAGVKSFTVGLAYENRFLLKELQSQGLAVAIPLKVGVLSVGGHFYGYNQYRSTKGGLGYSMKLTEKFFAGVQLNYQGLFLNQNYGSKHSITAELGVIGYLTDKWKIGASVNNIGRMKLSDFEDDRFSTKFRLGTSYHLQKVLFALEVEKEIDEKLQVKYGMEYEAFKNFYVRFGANYQPINLSFGIGYQWKWFRIDLGSSYAQHLGWSPHFSLNYSIKEK